MLRYFNGFSLEGEERYFQAYIPQRALCVAGFSYGAQQAFEYVYASKKRVDRLVLLSPAFFQTQKASFLRAQLRYFDTDREAYVAQFLKNVSYPGSETLSSVLKTGSREELEALLNYVWDAEKLEEVRSRGTVIEVFLGTEDRIIDSAAAFDFFQAHATVYLIKGAGHLLRGGEKHGT